MFATINGLQMAFTDEGKGIPLLFLHGFPLNREAWSSQVQAFKARFRVIVPDLRGFGESESTAGPVPMSRFGEDIWALGQHLGLGPVILVGHSMGGYIALAIARTRPAWLRGLVLVSTKAGKDSLETANERRQLARQVMVDGPQVATRPMAANMLSAANTDEQKAAAVLSCMTPASPEGISGALYGMALRPAAVDVLGRIRVPTLVVAGSEDSIIPPSEAGFMARTIPNSKLSIIPGAGHLVAVDQSEAFNDQLMIWLAWGCNGVHLGSHRPHQPRLSAAPHYPERRRSST